MSDAPDNIEPKKPRWTPAQAKAIATIDRNLLVSAAAGSGKTSVLAERCAYLVCEAPEPFRCDIDELLVVTFTVAAASEMRTRIARALNDRLEKAIDKKQDSIIQRLSRQIALIDRASIGTIHSFCSEVIRTNFHLLAIDPHVQMITEEEGALLRIETARDLFADRYEHDDSGAFQRFVDRYGDGNDQTPRSRIIRAAAMVESLIDPDGWIEQSRRRISEVAEGTPLRDTEFGKQLFARIRSVLKGLIDRCHRLLPQLAQDGALAKYHAYTTLFLATLTECATAFGGGDLDALAAIVSAFDPGRQPTLQKLTPAQLTLKEEMAAIRKEMLEGEFKSFCRFSEADWRDGMSRITEPTNVFLDLLVDFRSHFRAAKSELRTIDFNDLERLALRVLREPTDSTDLCPTDAARAYQRRFKHVLVDEYQDVNELQDSILALVSRSKRDGHAAANFFCVGDVKQSIYRFRLAEPKRFLERYATYAPFDQRDGDDDPRPGERIDLQTNFRSRGALLDTLNGIFRRLMLRETAEVDYDDAQFLIAPDDSPYDPASAHAPITELHLLAKPDAAHKHAGDDDDAGDASSAESDDAAELDRTEREAVFIAQQIRDLIDGGRQPAMRVLERDGTHRRIRFGDIAILMRSMRFKADAFASILRRYDIPVHCNSGSGFFETMEVRDVLALLKVLDNRRQDIPLAALLRSPIAAMQRPEDAMATIRMAYPSRGGNFVPFHEAVVRYANDHTDTIALSLQLLLSQLDRWRDLTQRRPLAEVLWSVFTETGYLAFVEGLDDGEQRVANLILLHERARQFGTFRRQSLGRFMRFLDSLEVESDLSAASIAAEAGDVVRVMSVHASKGLEFPVVFLPDLGKAHNLTDARGAILFDREAGLGLQACDAEKRVRYPSLASTIVGERLRQQMLAEEMRILYVAATRAREKLILCGTCKADQHDKWRQTWAGHRGALPAASVLCGGCMLDWLGPAMTAMQNDPEARTLSFEIISHTADELSMELVPRRPRRRDALSPTEQAIARLEPLADAPAESEEASAIWNRLTRTYRYDVFTRIPATQGMTSAGKSATNDSQALADFPMLNPSPAAAANFKSLLRRPRASAERFEPTAADIGSATHLLLEHLNYRTATDRAALERHRDELTVRKLIDAAVAREIDLDSIEWLIHSDIGDLLRRHADRLLREVPINRPQAVPVSKTLRPFCDQSLDRTVLRGRVDAVLPLDENQGGVIVIDFKTDRVTGARLDQRVELYRPQLLQYAEVLGELIDRNVSRSLLVFLHVRSIVDVSV